MGVKELVGVLVGSGVKLDVGVEVIVGVLVWVRVDVGVRVLVGVLVNVRVRVAVGVFEGVFVAWARTRVGVPRLNRTIPEKIKKHLYIPIQLIP